MYNYKRWIVSESVLSVRKTDDLAKLIRIFMFEQFYSTAWVVYSLQNSSQTCLVTEITWWSYIPTYSKQVSKVPLSHSILSDVSEHWGKYQQQLNTASWQLAKKVQYIVTRIQQKSKKAVVSQNQIIFYFTVILITTKSKYIFNNVR